MFPGPFHSTREFTAGFWSLSGWQEVCAPLSTLLITYFQATSLSHATLRVTIHLVMSDLINHYCVFWIANKDIKVQHFEQVLNTSRLPCVWVWSIPAARCFLRVRQMMVEEVEEATLRPAAGTESNTHHCHQRHASVCVLITQHISLYHWPHYPHHVHWPSHWSPEDHWQWRGGGLVQISFQRISWSVENHQYITSNWFLSRFVHIF